MSTVYRGVHVAYYAKFRPTDFGNVIDTALEYLAEKINRKAWTRAVDIGTGTGQGAAILAPHFPGVYAYDSSPDQIEKARSLNRFSNIEFDVSTAEKIALPDNYADLVTCSQAIHWFDHDRFYPEIKRLLKPGGVLAAFGYTNTPTVEVPTTPDRSRALSELISLTYNRPELRAHWVPKLKVVDRCYRDLPFPMEDRIHREDFRCAIEMPVSDLVGYINTWSDLHRCRDADASKAESIVNDFNEQVKGIVGDNQLDMPVQLVFKQFLLLGRKSY